MFNWKWIQVIRMLKKQKYKIFLKLNKFLVQLGIKIHSQHLQVAIMKAENWW